MMTVAMAMVMSVAMAYRGKLLRGEEAPPTYLNAGKSGRHAHGWYFHGGGGRAWPVGLLYGRLQLWAALAEPGPTTILPHCPCDKYT